MLEPTPCKAIETYEALERVNKAIVGSNASEEMLAGVLDSMLDIFDCERAWLLYPCTLETESYQVPMERTRPEFPGAGVTNEQIPFDDWTRYVFSKALESDAPVAFDDSADEPSAMSDTLERFQIKSLLLVAIHPKGDKPWLLGIHHCKSPRSYAACSELFRAVGRRVADGLTTLLANAELRKSEQQLRVLLEHAPEAILILDCDRMMYIEVNPMAEELFGMSHDELLQVGGPLESSPTLQESGAASATAMESFVTSTLAGEFPIFEWNFVRTTGEVVTCEVRLSRLPDPDRKLIRASITDIMPRKRAEKERLELEAKLAHTQKMEAIGNLTGGLAHDFNNLLTVILGNLDLLDMEPGDPDFVRMQSAHIRSAAERAGSLTHRLLAFARRQPLRPRVLDIASLVRGMDDLLRRTLGEHIEIELVLGGGLWRCEADGTQLESALLNLAINARDAMPEGGRMTIEAGNARLDAEYAANHSEVTAGQYVLIAVTDSGSGMEPELLKEVFAPFFSTKGPGEGTGLGLAMVYGFVKQSGGHVKAYSEVGVGTTMRIYLPRSNKGIDEHQQAHYGIRPQQGSGELILVVEDEAGVRELTVVLLNRLGYRTLSASGVDQAIQLIKQHPEIDLLLTDVVLVGDKTGSQLASIAREHRPHLKVLFMSGYTENAIIHNGRLDPGVNLLEKPFTKSTLSIRVRESLQ